MISDVETLNKAVTPDEGNVEYDGYFCIQTIPHVCNCRPDRPWVWVHHQRKIVVWEDKDGDILQVASEFKKGGFEPKVVDYKVIYGKAIPWDDIPNGSDLV